MKLSISQLFGGGDSTPAAPNTATPAPTATPAAPGNLPDGAGVTNPATPGTDVNGVVPATPAEPATTDSPLAQFDKLWEPVTTPEGQDDTPVQLDPAKLQEIINKADFTKTISPENLNRIAAGGEEAQAAFTESLNTVAQQVLLQSTMASNKMVEQAIATALAKQTASLPDLIKSQTTTNNLQTANPIFSNPAVKPIIEAVQAQLAAKNPNATANELTEMAQNFVTVMGEAFSPTPDASTEANQGQGDIDWTKFLSGT